MSEEIRCPECAREIVLGQARTGDSVVCPGCHSILLLRVQVTRPAKRSPGPTRQRRFDGPLSEHHRVEIDRLARRHLSSWIDLDPADLQSALDLLSARSAYDRWTIPKPGNGGSRTIDSPKPELKRIQRRILDRLLYRIPVSNAAHGFVPGRSIVTGARVHLEKAREVLNLDLKDAFPSVESGRVKHLLVRHVKMPLKHQGPPVEHAVVDRCIAILVRLITHEDRLPQGAPTSGYLLNLACTTLDKAIYRLLAEQAEDLRYTRYADDLTISSRGAIPTEIRQAIPRLIRNNGYLVNPMKIRYASRDRNQRLEVTGLILEKGKVRIPADTLDRYRATIHRATLTTDLDEQKRVEVRSIVAYVGMVYPRIPGKIARPLEKYLARHEATPGAKRPRFGVDLYGAP